MAFRPSHIVGRPAAPDPKTKTNGEDAQLPPLPNHLARQKQSESGGKSKSSSVHENSSNRSSLQSHFLFRLASTKTNSSAISSSKNTAFYSALTNPSSIQSSTSFHTAELGLNDPGLAIPTNQIPKAALAETRPINIQELDHTSANSKLHAMSKLNEENPQNSTYSYDAESTGLVHALARQYVNDAEAAGPEDPNYYNNTNSNSNQMQTAHAVQSLQNEALDARASGLPAVASNSSSYYARQNSNPHVNDFDLGRDYSSENAATATDSLNTSSGFISDQAPQNRRGQDEEFEDDANEVRHFISARVRYPPTKYNIDIDSSVPLGAVLFLFGFLILPLWWIGMVFPRRPETEVAKTWRKYNSLMTLLSLPLLGLILALGGWHATHD